MSGLNRVNVRAQGFPKQIRAFVVHRNEANLVYEFHLRGVKVAQAPLFGTSPKDIHTIVDSLHARLHSAIKFLNNNPTATLAPAIEGTAETLVPSHADL